MSRTFRNVCIAVCGLVMLFVGSSSAFAALSINTTSTVATNNTGTTLFLLGRDGRRVPLTCTSFIITANIDRTGGVSIPTGNVRFAGCTLNSVAVTITQTAAWTGGITALLSATGQITGVLLRITIPNPGINVRNLLGINMNLGGSASALVTVAATTPPALITVNNITFNNAALDALNVCFISGTNPDPNVPVGSCGGFLGVFQFNPAVTGTLL
jgi:hypothetical protein